VKREVLGYLPYWEMGYTPQRWDLLTILAWFAASIDATGQVTDPNGWGGTATEALVQEAHGHGVIVIVTVTNFDATEIGALLSSATARAKAIQSCLDLMAEHGADGINIDFEFVPLSAKSAFVSFMTELKQAVAAAQPNGWEGHVSLAGPSVDWSGSYDYDQLLIHTDGIMVMAYGYHWTAGDPGPLSPLYGGSPWGKFSIAWTIDDYVTWGGQENLGKVLLGLPWYGNRWPVADTSVPGAALGSGKAVFFRDVEPEALELGKSWDTVTHTPYYHKTINGGLWQVWYDDGQSFEDKLAYADEQGLGGIGIWALGYDGELPDYWDAIEAVLGTSAPPVEPLPEVAPEAGPELVPETETELGPEPGAQAEEATPGEPEVEAPAAETPWAPDTPSREEATAGDALAPDALAPAGIGPPRNGATLNQGPMAGGGSCSGGARLPPLTLALLVLALWVMAKRFGLR
jgi:spore germination protein YaaH